VNQERVFQILLGPHMSEKAAMAAENGNQYVFRVALDATKNEIKTSVEQLFKVRVDDVRTLRVKGKSKRNRFGVHTSSTWKKAYVRLEQGQEIDLAAIS
jgi:large subunit ribosomal protein L23